METGITYTIQDYLANQTELLAFISGKYVRSEKTELYKANIEHLFPNDKEKAKLINPGSYIASIVFDWISSYLWEPKEKQNINYIDLVEWLLTTGFIRVFQNIDTWKLESIKANKYFYDKNQRKEYFVNIYEKEEKYRYWVKNTYLLVETFCENIFERKLFKISNLDNLSVWEQVPFDSLPFLEWKAERLKIDNLERIVIEKQVERPILEKIKTIIFSIEKKLSEIDKNFLDYTEQFKIFRNIEIPKNAYKTLENWIKIVDFNKLWKLIQVNEVNGYNWGLEIVRNTNDLLINSIDYLDKQIRSISAITGIPLFAFWIQQETWNDSGTSKIKSSGLFYKKIEKYREVLIKLFLEFWKTFNIPDDEQILEFGEIVTTDISEIVDVQQKMLTAWIQSRKRAIMKINSTDEIEAEEILKEILEEEKIFSNNQNNLKYN